MHKSYPRACPGIWYTVCIGVCRSVNSKLSMLVLYCSCPTCLFCVGRLYSDKPVTADVTQQRVRARTQRENNHNNTYNIEVDGTVQLERNLGLPTVQPASPGINTEPPPLPFRMAT